MKTCKKCQIDKEVTCFSKDKNSKDGLETYCKQCRKEIKDNWYLNNKETEIRKVANYKKTKLDAISKTQINRRTPGYRYKMFIQSDKERNKGITISSSEHLELIQKSCFYCDKVTFGIETGCGLDRLNNKRGYDLDNVVPCCKACNNGRGDNFTSEEWKIMITALKQYKQDAV